MTNDFDNGVNLPKQFLISDKIPDLYNKWTQNQLGRWFVVTSPQLPVIALHNTAGLHFGYLIGWAAYNGFMLKDQQILNCATSNFPSILDSICGRFAVIVQSNEKTDVYTDASGLLPVVYNEGKMKLAGSTPTVLAPLLDLEFDNELRDVYQIPETYGWYPFGLTPYVGIRRLLPNHSLCLETGDCTRFWPKTDLILEESDKPNEVTSKIATLVQEATSAIINGGKGYCHITAGYDSRMVMAATKPYSASCMYETVSTTKGCLTLDCRIAQMIVQDLDLQHEFIEYIEPEEQDINDWLYRTGYCIFDSVTNLATTAARNDRHYHALMGTCADILKAKHWTNFVPNADDHGAEQLLIKLGHPACQTTIIAAKQWIENLPVKTGEVFWDIVHIEQRYGCWAGPSVYGHNVSYPSLSPFNSRQIYNLMMSLPKDYRKSLRFVDDFINILWPELANYPYNRARVLIKLSTQKLSSKR